MLGPAAHSPRTWCTPSDQGLPPALRLRLRVEVMNVYHAARLWVKHRTQVRHRAPCPARGTGPADGDGRGTRGGTEDVLTAVVMLALR